jgi:hypothetical protein
MAGMIMGEKKRSMGKRLCRLFRVITIEIGMPVVQG